MLRLISIILLTLTATLPAAKLRILGLRSFSKKDLTESIAGRLDYIKKRPATTFRADDAAFLIEDYLRDHGLPEAEVTWTLNQQTIVLTVNEGPPQFLDIPAIDGAPTNLHKEIIEQFQAPFPETEGKRAFIATAVPEATERVTTLLHSKGYWHATTHATRLPIQANKKIPYLLHIETGKLLTLASPGLNTPVPPSAKLIETLDQAANQPATAELILAVRNTIKSSYQKLGYPNLNLDLIRDLSPDQLAITFQVTPGQRFTNRSLKITGLKKTNPKRIQGRFQKMLQRNFDQDQINSQIKKLLATGAFNSIRLNEPDFNQPLLDLTLHFTEGKARGQSIALGADSEQGVVIGSRYHDNNLFGQLYNFTAGLEYTTRGLLGAVTLTDPFLFNRDLRLHNRAYLITREFDSYDKIESGISSQLSWQWGKHYFANLGAHFSYTSVDSTLPPTLIGDPNYFLTRIHFNQKYDRRNDPVLPSDGWFARFDNSIGFTGEIAFLETDAQLSYYQTINEKSSYALNLRGGLIVPSSNKMKLPIDTRKFLGGANSVRSFPDREMGPTFNDLPLGGTNWWIANAEYVHTIYGPVRGVAFLDAGALDGETEVAAGLGLRIDLPVGPVRLEYGRSLTQDQNEPSGAFHFAIGTTF